MAHNVVIPFSLRIGPQAHCWTDYMQNGVYYLHTFTPANQHLLILPPHVSSCLKDQNGGKIVVALRNGFVKLMKLHINKGKAFILDGWPEFWSKYQLTAGCHAVISLVDGCVLMMMLYEQDYSEKLISMLPIVRHCRDCYPDSKLTTLSRRTSNTFVLSMTVDPTIVEWSARHTRYSSWRIPICSRGEWVAGSDVLSTDDFFFDKKTTLTNSHKARLFGLIRHGRQPIPILVFGINSPTMLSELVIPREFAVTWLPRRDRTLLIFKESGGQPILTMYQVTNDSRAIVRVGWDAFTAEHGLLLNTIVALRFRQFDINGPLEAVAYSF